MSLNSYGRLFRVTTWGESHGPAIGCVIDGCPPGVSLSEGLIQPALNRRRPGQSKHTTQRRETDQVEILSGVFEGYTTGTPISLLIRNTDQRSKDYSEIADQFRAGHADYTYWSKYKGFRDYRGGGRTSARETANRVAAGAVAQAALDHLLDTKILIRASLVEMGGLGIDRSRFDWNAIDQNPFFCGDPVAAQTWDAELTRLRKDGSSAGGIIEVVAENVPVGLGAPIYAKLDSELASALMSINAVKGVEMGDGFGAARLTGISNADEMTLDDNNHPAFPTNHAGGILGGISTGQPVIARVAIKPTSSILTPRRSLNRFGEPVEVITKGRHDPCVAIRGVPVVEAMVQCVILDQLLLSFGQGTAIGSRPWDQR